MPGLGYLIQGFTRGMNDAKERNIKDEYLKAQKKIVDAQFKALQKKQEYFAAHPEFEKYQYGFPKELALIEMLTGVGMGNTTGQIGPEHPGGEKPTEQPGTPAQQGLPGMMSNQLMQGYINKTFGTHMGEPQLLRGMSNPETGKPETWIMDKESKQIIGSFPESIKPESFDITSPEGTYKSWVNPYELFGTHMEEPQLLNPEKRNKQAIGSFKVKTSSPEQETRKELKEGINLPPEAFKVKISPPEQETRKELKNGILSEFKVNKYTGEEIPGTKKILKGATSQNAIYMANMENLAIPAVDNIIKNTFYFDEKGDLNIYFSARLQGTFQDLAAALGGEIANDAMKVAYALVRPESGAAINEGELKNQIMKLLPKLFTHTKYAKNQLLSIGNVIDTYLKKIEPNYKPHARKLFDQSFKKLETAKSHPETSTSSEYDYEWVPGEGIH